LVSFLAGGVALPLGSHETRYLENFGKIRVIDYDNLYVFFEEAAFLQEPAHLEKHVLQDYSVPFKVSQQHLL